jgi:hypothetical protein
MLAVLASLFCWGAQDQRKPKAGAELTVELAATRDTSKVLLDGKVRNTGGAPARNLLLIFKFVAPDNKVVATRQANLEARSLEPGEDGPFSLETEFPPRAVSVLVEIQNKGGIELTVRNRGPFPID